MKMNKAPLFPTVLQARFIRRLNRFTVECLLGGAIVQAHLPNPGRLWELLLPGLPISLVRNEPLPDRATAYTAVAVAREGLPVLLHTGMANSVVQHLIEQNRICGLENAQIIKREASFGKCRFDFLLRKDNIQHVLEAKSCTLFGRHVAMFPDAVTERGRRHLLALSDLVDTGMTCGVIFVVHCPHVRFFLPDYHTDFEFARTFGCLKNKLIYRAVSVAWTEDLYLKDDVHELEIPWEVMEREAQDSGSYILILRIPNDITIAVGSLGHVFFPRGYYMYIGSSKLNLTKRIERHLRKRKKYFWHIDYLRDHAAACIALPIRSNALLEHDVASAISRIANWSVPGLGSSDCSCETHLFAMQDDPLQSPASSKCCNISESTVSAQICVDNRHLIWYFSDA